MLKLGLATLALITSPNAASAAEVELSLLNTTTSCFAVELGLELETSLLVQEKNVLGGELELCCTDPLTGKGHCIHTCTYQSPVELQLLCHLSKAEIKLQISPRGIFSSGAKSEPADRIDQ